MKKGAKIKMENINCDFGGYATRNNLVCGDGRTIRRDAFKDCDGKTVPLIWNHDHSNPDAILGHALLENREDGVYAYCTLNETEQGQRAKELVKHGDVSSLSIYANKLKQVGADVVHGTIRELSLVIAASNPGAYIDFVMAHGDDENASCLYANYDVNALTLFHSDDKKTENSKKEETTVTEENKTDNKEKTIGEIFDTFTDEQKQVVYALIGQALEDSETSKDEDEDDDEGGNDVKHNVFENDNETNTTGYISHSDQEKILNLAKSSNVGSFQAALDMYADDNALQHDAISSGFAQTSAGNVTELFPEYKDVRPGAPELITNDQGWISVVMSKVHKSPISRIRTRQVDIRNIQELRAKGYKKGKEKSQTGNFALVSRTTDPQTIYVKNALHRDDIIDIVDFDYVQYLYGIDRMMLNEELAIAMMLGDGREVGAEGKIEADKIRPIWLDDDLYTIHTVLDIEAMKAELNGTNTGANFGENYITSEALINTVLYSREQFKGSGTPDFYCTPHMLNVMLLARDMNGRRIYSSKAELASALNVGDIYTCEQFEGKTRSVTGGTRKLLGIIVNLADYSLGATKGGQVTHFTQFDIDFNQQKSLLETRVSGALTRVYSAIAIEEPTVTAEPAG